MAEGGKEHSIPDDLQIKNLVLEHIIPDIPVIPEKSKKKKKKNKSKSQGDNAEKEPEVAAQSTPAVKTMKDINKVLMEEEIKKAATARNVASDKKWEFWKTQPVPKLDEKIDEVGKIEPDKEDVKKDSYSLPKGFEWDTLDLGNPTELEEVYMLLNGNYVEDEDNMFRFDYSPDFLKWVLRPPNWVREWHCGVRASKSKKLLGFISAVPASVKVYSNVIEMVEINFLCVHKKLRHKRVAPVLIKEITRRVNLRGIFQAVYTAGVVLPKPVGVCRYYHRSLNPKKLVAVKFSYLGRNQTMARLMKLMKLPEETTTKGLRPLISADIPQCHKLLSEHLKQFDLAPVFTEEEFRHYFVPIPGVIESYVVENQGKITDMASFFSLPSSIMHHPEYDRLNAAYSFYTATTKTDIKTLMRDILILAKKKEYDVFNALDLMKNKEFLKDLKFGMGDGNLHFYLYNYKCPDIPSDKMALVLQ